MYSGIRGSSVLVPRRQWTKPPVSRCSPIRAKGSPDSRCVRQEITANATKRARGDHQGAAGGIGRAVARRFVVEGAHFRLADHYGCAELAEGLAASGSRLIDIVFTVAGIAWAGNAGILSEAAWDRVMAVNLRGVFLSCQAVIPAMRAARYGRIAMIGSVLAKDEDNPCPGIDRTEQEHSDNVAYCAAKAGAHAMTLYLAKELSADNITGSVARFGDQSPSGRIRATRCGVGRR